MNDLKQLALDVALLLSGFGFIAGMAVVVLMSLARCLSHTAETLVCVGAGIGIGVPLWLWDATGYLQAWARV